jgi:hypothetical protein
VPLGCHLRPQEPGAHHPWHQVMGCIIPCCAALHLAALCSRQGMGLHQTWLSDTLQAEASL